MLTYPFVAALNPLKTFASRETLREINLELSSKNQVLECILRHRKCIQAPDALLQTLRLDVQVRLPGGWLTVLRH